MINIPFPIPLMCPPKAALNKAIRTHLFHHHLTYHSHSSLRIMLVAFQFPLSHSSVRIMLVAFLCSFSIWHTIISAWMVHLYGVSQMSVPRWQLLQMTFYIRFFHELLDPPYFTAKSALFRFFNFFQSLHASMQALWPGGRSLISQCFGCVK